MQNWYDNAKPLLKAKKITQKDIAIKLNCTQGAVSHKLTGFRQASIEEISVIADMLGVNIIVLIDKDAIQAVTPDEIEVIKSFRAMNRSRKVLALKLLEVMPECAYPDLMPS